MATSPNNPAPSAPPSVPEVEAPVSNEALFSELADSVDIGEESIDLSPTPVEPTAPAAPVAPVQPAVVQPAQPVVAPVEPPAPVAPVQPVVEQPAQPPVVQQPQVAPVEPVAAPTQPPTREEILQRRNSLVDQIATSYTISDEDKALLTTEPEKVLPKLAAKIAVDVYDMVRDTMAAQLPRFIEEHTQARTASEGVGKQFLERWPALSDPKHAPAVMRIARAYRQLNPSVPNEQAIDEIGAQAYVALRIPFTQQATPAAAPPAAQPGTVSQPAAPGNVLPFRPAAPGGASVVAATPTPQSMWDELASYEPPDH